MQATRLFATTGDAVARIDLAADGSASVALSLEGSVAQCVAVDPRDPDRVYVGTHDDGVYRSLDGGASWQPVGAGIPHRRVPSIAVSPCHVEQGRSVVYAGTEPSNLYRSDDDGATWRDFPALPQLPSAPGWSFPPRPWTSHVRWIALHPHDPRGLYTGIELGGVMRSLDGGTTWEDRKPGSQHDAHALATHSLAPGRVYEAAGGGVAISDDAGATWRAADEGMDRHYTWGLAVDSADPDLWYVSSSFSARYAHARNGDARARLWRRRGAQGWEQLAGGLPDPLPFMPYALLAPRDQPGVIIAGFQHGELWLSEDAGDGWRRLDMQLPGLLALAE